MPWTMSRADTARQKTPKTAVAAPADVQTIVLRSEWEKKSLQDHRRDNNNRREKKKHSLREREGKKKEEKWTEKKKKGSHNSS